jgi:regulatory protein YycI of two-component signal transduction system YycFG
MKKYIKIIIVIIVIVILCLFFLYKKESQKNNKINEISNAVKMAKTDIKPTVKPKPQANSIKVIKLPKEVRSLEKAKIINNIPSKPTRLEYKPPVANKVNTTKSKKQDIQTYHTPYFSIKEVYINKLNDFYNIS